MNKKLQRRLSDVEAIERFRELEKKKKEIQPEIDRYEESHKIEFFKPFPHQQKILDLIHGGKRVVLLQGANRIGKTVLGACVVGSACLGIQPWDKKETIWGRKKVKARILCSNWEDHAGTVIVPKLKEYLPIGQYRTTKNNLSVEDFFEFKNGSTIELITDTQDTRGQEGWEGDIIWADEPFSRDKFTANLRGLSREIGVFLMTMTAVKESWMLDDIVRNIHPSYASITEIPMDANPTLGKEYKETFRAGCKISERIARIEGGWLNLVGLVWPGFDADKQIIDSFDVPTDWPVVAMIDFHPKEPQAISYYAFDRQDRGYVIDEEFKHLTPEGIADTIIRAKMSHAWRLEEAFIDPLSKQDTWYMKQRGIDIPDAFSIIKERFWRHGINLNVGSKDQPSGILNIEQMLMGPNGMPTLFFFRSLVEKINNEGHIWEIQRWTYDDDGKPKQNFHFMENLYRMSLTGVKWSKMRNTSEPIKSEIDFNPLLPNYGIRKSETEFNVWK